MPSVKLSTIGIIGLPCLLNPVSGTTLGYEVIWLLQCNQHSSQSRQGVWKSAQASQRSSEKRRQSLVHFGDTVQRTLYTVRVLCDFYCAIYVTYSAKRGLAIACRPSVCPSICNVGGSGSHRWEILETNYMDSS